jgi:hypothetical protein
MVVLLMSGFSLGITLADCQAAFAAPPRAPRKKKNKRPAPVSEAIGPALKKKKKGNSKKKKKKKKK